uniref:Bet v I/Major latex protein domain-containing protein n=1 Tax=Kalanchoe fedtschenkoi TaxID=63787 RepID=A0A7N0UKD3_KALFE
MGVKSFTEENTSPVAASRLFSALIVDSGKLIPQLLPHIVKGVDVIQGDGGAGTIEKVHFTDGFKFSYVKHRINELDEKNRVCKYEMVEGGPLGEKLEKIGYEVKIEASGDGGSVCKMTSIYYSNGEFEVDEEEIKEGKETAIGIYKVIEGYLLNNPQVYA